MHDETDEPARRLASYRAFALGFSLYGVNMAASTLVAIAELLLLFAIGLPNLGPLLGIDDFHFRFDAFRVWGRLFACLALASARPPEESWRRRAGLLAALALADVGLWAVVDAVPLGLAALPTRHMVFFTRLRIAVSWSRLFLLFKLSSDFSRHAGDPHAGLFGRTALGTAMIGVSVWFLTFLMRFDWAHPWPVVERPPGPQALELSLIGELLALACMVQASLLVIAAAIAAWRLVADASREIEASDPWGSR